MGGEEKRPGPIASPGAGRFSWLPLRLLLRMSRQASSDWIDDNAPRLGAAVAFYTLLSLAPVIVLAVALSAVVYGQEAAEGRLASELGAVAGPQVARTIQEIVKGAYQPRIGLVATLLGLAILAFAASSVFVELRDDLNTIWHVSLPPYRNNAGTVIRLIGERFYSFALVLGTGFLLLVSLVLNSWMAAMWLSVPRAATWILSYLLVAVLFATLYRIVPDVELQWTDVALGAIITSLLFMIGKEFLGLYFAYASFGVTYSAAGSPIVVLLWVYYSAQLFFWGAEFTGVYTRTVGSQCGRECLGPQVHARGSGAGHTEPRA